MRRIAILGANGRTPSKFDALKGLLEEHREEGRKVLIFSFFLDVLRQLENHFDVYGTIQGSVPQAQRMDIIDRFHHAKGHRILISQISVGGVGLNLHAASAVVIMEPQWKPSTEEQAIARAHRMGQTRSVIVHRLLTRDSVEERMVEVLGKKARLFETYARESAIKDQSKDQSKETLDSGPTIPRWHIITMRAKTSFKP